MPRKDRLAITAERNRLPKPSARLQAPDYNSPVGSWKSDQAIAALLKSGLCDSRSMEMPDDVHGRYAFLRGYLLAAARNALLWSMAHRSNISGRDRRETENRELQELMERLYHFVSERSQNQKDLSGLFGPDDWARLPQTEAANLAAMLSSKLGEFIVPISHATSRRGRDPNRDVLSQHFITEMRFFWTFATRRPAPRSGGKLLIDLAAGAWRDGGIERRNKKRPLEDWLAERFRRVPVCP